MNGEAKGILVKAAVKILMLNNVKINQRLIKSSLLRQNQKKYKSYTDPSGNFSMRVIIFDIMMKRLKRLKALCVSGI